MSIPTCGMRSRTIGACWRSWACRRGRSPAAWPRRRGRGGAGDRPRPGPGDGTEPHDAPPVVDVVPRPLQAREKTPEQIEQQLHGLVRSQHPEGS